ncbi:MAG: LamG-like jellyroll fold domain-containing protein [Bacteroidaceae bacterium]
MKKNQLISFVALATMSLVTATAQVDVNYEKYPDYSPVLRPDYSLIWHATNKKSRAATLRPNHVNNGENKYFPPVFNQAGGSCGSASRIGYMFNYEINALRGADGMLEENQYPTHFTWLLTGQGSGKETMAAANGIPRSTVYGGRTYSKLFGYQECTNNDYGWMQGYDKWYEAMNNRILRSANFPQGVDTEEGREAVKNWIWNHNGDEDFSAGGICGLGVASACVQGSIPNTPANIEAGVVGLKYVTTWGKQTDHALTMVGYDDRIEFDLDGNGVFGEKNKDEVGAWIIVNSWGYWANKGFIYCPYKYGCTMNTSTGYWYPEIYYARKNYRPLRTIKIKMDYSKRSELCLGAGISSDINATVPEQTIQFEHFKNAGDADGDGVDAETPMLGKWADGMHYEPMEFGYDLTDLSNGFDTRKPLKYFFIIDSKGTASGKGKIWNASIIDYEFDKAGVELPFDITAEGVTVETAGNRTLISMVVTGEPIYAPRNLSIADNLLQWQKPQKSLYPVTSYNLYKGNDLYTSIGAKDLTYNIGTDTVSVFSVSANYNVSGTKIESTKSNTVSGQKEAASTRNRVRSFSSSGFEIPDVFKTRYSNATIEFWLKPSSCSDWNQQIGPGWGSFLFHTTSSRQFVAGWSTGSERFESNKNALSVGAWNHIAIVVKGNQIIGYVNGNVVGSVTSTGNSGIGGFGSFRVGLPNSNGLAGQMDEFRIWSEARTQAQIQKYMRSEIGNPIAETGLLAYYKMDEIKVNNDQQRLLRDAAGGQNAAYLTDIGYNSSFENEFLTNNSVAKASFINPKTPCYAMQELQFLNNSAPNTQAWEWTAEEAGIRQLNVQNPFMTFAKAGDYAVTLKVTSVTGEVSDTTGTIHIENMPKPQANFIATTNATIAGERISLSNKSIGIGCSYEWDMPGADIEKQYTVNAGVSYSKAGTYTITLKVTNASGTSSYAKDITVSRAIPIVNFQIRPSVVVKGETVYLEDMSKCDPTHWNWILSNSKYSIGVEGQNSTIVPTVSGIYDAQHTVGNDLGQNTLELKQALVVCNADAKTGLSFSGSGEKVSFTGPLSQENDNRFTIDYWMYPTKLSSDCNQMGDKAETLLMKTDADGAMSVTVAGKTVTSEKGYVIPSQWHHYAITFNAGSFSFYRDGESITTAMVNGLKCPALVNGFVLGSRNAPMSAVIDEFRIWNTVLSSRAMKQYNNEPIESTDIADAMSSKKLQVYYQFNQSSGNVMDATTNGYIGVRSGFGPEGDAWSSSLGVFCLNGDSKPSKNVTSKYLTNYKAPFLYTEEKLSTETSKVFALETETATSGWVIENAVSNDTAKTQWGVRTDKESSMTCQTGWAGFSENLKDHKVYQSVTLPAGLYELSVTPFERFDVDDSYLVVNKDLGLPSTENKSTSLAYAPLATKSVQFMLAEDTKVSLGLLVNLSGIKHISIKDFTLISKDANVILANGVTGVENVVTDSNLNGLSVYINNGIVTLSTTAKMKVLIHSVDATSIYDKELDGVDHVSLEKGIYIINGKKMVVK